jgi:NADPH:quinone reductase-like Zn-dependent oxidoreductase
MVCRAWGAPDVLQLENVPPRALRLGEVRIRVRAAGVNFADSLMVGGTYQVKPPFPFTPGLEAAGEVIETGDGVPSLRTGQRVLAVLRNGGGYAEEIVLDAATVLPIPETMDFVTAAAFPVAYGTSHFALTHRGDLQSGETLLVLDAAGGAGLTAVEIGKARGARVIAAASGAHKLEVARSRGADEFIDYRSESLRDRVPELTGVKAPMSSTTRSAATRSTRRYARSIGRRGCWSSVLPRAHPGGASQSDPGQEYLGDRRRLGRADRAPPRVDEPHPRRTLALVGRQQAQAAHRQTFFAGRGMVWHSMP